MYFDTLLENLSAKPALLLAVFAAFLVLMDAALVRWLKLGDVAWKRVDYVWLGAAALGVLASSAQAGRVLSERYLVGERASTAAAYEMLQRSLREPAGVCLPRTRSEFSPPNFDEIVQDQQLLCSRAKALAERLPAAKESFPDLDNNMFIALGEGIKHEMSFVAEISKLVSHYQERQQRYKRVTADTQASTGEFLFAILGPLLLTLALALRITKVTGEIANAKRRSAA